MERKRILTGKKAKEFKKKLAELQPVAKRQVQQNIIEHQDGSISLLDVLIIGYIASSLLESIDKPDDSFTESSDDIEGKGGEFDGAGASGEWSKEDKDEAPAEEHEESYEDSYEDNSSDSDSSSSDSDSSSGSDD
jgi:hypothetical protein